jgi:superfamily II DNA or RNA helicase
LVGIEVARRLNAELILVLAPSLALVDQNAQVWANNMEDIRATIKVCSDKRNKKEEDAGVAEAADLGPNVTTDPEIIAAFLRRSGRRVVFATYASSPQIAAAMRLCPEIRASIAVCDEAHHCAGVAGKSPRTILDEEDIRVEKRLFMTATPTIYAARDLTNLSRKRKIVLHSMDNEDDFGPVSHRLPFARAIELDLLCPYQVVVIPVYDTEIHQLIESNPYVTVDGGDTKILAYSLATQIACVRAMHAYKCQRMVSFHPKIAHSERFSDSFHLAVNLVSTEVSSDIAVCAEHIDGSGMPRAQRRDRLARFTDVTDPTRRLLSNVKVMAEGVDVPGIDAITMIDTMRNKAAMLQIVGRAIRKAPGKTIGTILLPVLVKKGQTPHEALRNSEHAAIYKLLAALKSTDPDLAQDIKDLWIRVDPVTGEPIDTGRFILSAAQEVGAEFADAINVMLADTLAPHRLPDVPLQGPSAVRNHANRKPTVEEPPRTTSTHEHGESEDTYLSSDLAWERAMNAIIPLGRRYQWASYDGDLLGTLPEIGRSWDPFPVRLWWQHVTHNWTDSFPTPSQKQQLSDTLSFLAADVESWPLIRAEMAALSARPLYMHIDAWLTTNGDTADQDLYWLAYFKQIGPSGLLKTQEVCDLLTHPTMPIEQRVGVVVKALLIAGDECQRRGNSVAFVEGFLDALVYRSSNDTENRSPLQSGGFPVSLYKAGWAVGDPFFPEAMHAQKMYAELPVSVRRRLAQKG